VLVPVTRESFDGDACGKDVSKKIKIKREMWLIKFFESYFFIKYLNIVCFRCLDDIRY
jgi:hypothetical protein